MALAIQSPCFLKQQLPLLLPSKTKTRFRPTVTTTATKSEQPKPTNQETLQPPKKPITKTGVGFGSTSSPSSSQTQDSKKKRRASIVRRTPLEKPSFLSQQGKTPQPIQQQSQNETAFLLTWSGLGSLIIVEGLALSASGFLPEEWDKLFVKYLYPSFTPTVFLFVAGTVVYGLLKYQGQKP